jgi:SAM-dependent methyltransferase
MAIVKDLLRRSLPYWLKLRARQLAYLPLELCDRLSGPSPSPWPPRWLRTTVGDGDFDAVGQRFLRHLLELATLGPHERVLDVGCGVGRLALPLTRYLSPSGSYHGFDVVHPAIRWCQRHITPAFPHFRFEHAGIHHPLYNPRGRCLTRDYTFPHLDRSFDLVIVTSVFTHLLPAEVKHYLAEVHRVLKPGGRCLATFFLLNENSRARMVRPASRFHFQHQLDGCWTTSLAKPEAAVAYREEDVYRFLGEAGLELRGPIHFGSWCGRDEGRDGQDLLLLGKPLSWTTEAH